MPTADEGRATRKRIGEPFKPDPRVDAIAAEVAAELGLEARAIAARARRRGVQAMPIVRARAEVYRRAHARFLLSQVEVARALNLHPTSITYALRVSA